MRAEFVVLLLMPLVACQAVPATQAIDSCAANSAACAEAAQTLCALGEAGGNALAKAVPNPKTASDPMRDLVFDHAVCNWPADSTQSPPEPWLSRVVATLDGARTKRLDAFSSPTKYHVFRAATAAGVHVEEIPAPPADAEAREIWCTHMLPLIEDRPLTGANMYRLVEVDCGAPTSALITRAVNRVQASRLALEAKVRAEFKGDPGELEVELIKARSKGRPFDFGPLWHRLATRGKSETRWRWLKPVFAAKLGCGVLNSIQIEHGLDRQNGKWSKSDKAELASRLLTLDSGCKAGETPWWAAHVHDLARILEVLGPEGAALSKGLFRPGTPCVFIADRLAVLGELVTKHTGFEGRKDLPDAATQHWVVNEAKPAWTAAYAALEADAKKRCAAELGHK